MTLEEQIKNYSGNIINLSTQIDILNKQLQQLREQKKQYDQALISAMTQNNLQDQEINYMNKSITIGVENSYDTLSYKFLEECLLKLYRNDENKVKQVIKFIKAQRIKKSNYCIKMN
jgi:septal ring factor EnvC (AmiA/AmiB activator)